MRRSSNSIAACAVAATVLAAGAAEAPSPAWSRTAPSLYTAGSDVAIPRPGVLLLHDAPGSERVLARVRPRTAFGSPPRLAVVGESGNWLAVISAKLGNRVRGFVLRSNVRLVHVPFSVEVDQSSRRLTVWRNGIGLRRIHVAVGAPSTPTPQGASRSRTSSRTSGPRSTAAARLFSPAGRCGRLPAGAAVTGWRFTRETGSALRSRTAVSARQRAICGP